MKKFGIVLVVIAFSTALLGCSHQRQFDYKDTAEIPESPGLFSKFETATQERNELLPKACVDCTTCQEFQEYLQFRKDKEKYREFKRWLEWKDKGLGD